MAVNKRNTNNVETDNVTNTSPLLILILTLSFLTPFIAAIPNPVHAQLCPPDKSPMPLVYLCMEPTLPPTSDQIRSEIRSFIPSVPVSLRPHLNNILTWDDHDLSIAYEVGLNTVRRFSGGMPGPVDPSAIPAYQVKYWMVEVLKREGGLFKTLIPVVRSVPDEVLKEGWIRAVKLKRGH